MEAVVTKEQNRNQLLSIIRTQQLEILALQRRVEGLEAEDIGELRQQVLELQKWRNQAEERIRELEAKSAMTQGLAVFVGTSAVALVMEKVIEALKTIPLDDFEQKLNEVVVSMSVISPQFFQNTNKVDMEEAMEQVPGVTIIDGQANIRGGSGFSYGAGSRVLVLVDEMPMLAADANDVKWSFLPVESMSQVEIIKSGCLAVAKLFNYFTLVIHQG